MARAAKASPLRAVRADERKPEPLSLAEAVESGDVLEIMKAQRRIIAAGMAEAADNTRPQYSNELSKLNALITAEEERRAVVSAEASVVADLEPQAWDGTGY